MIDSKLIHYSLLIVGNNPSKQMQLYSNAKLVNSWRVYLEEKEIEEMMDRFKIKSVHHLVKYMTEWRGCFGGIDDVGLYCKTCRNPDGLWDWFVEGGYWENFFLFNKEINGDWYGYQATKDQIDWIAQSKRNLPFGILYNRKIMFQDEFVSKIKWSQFVFEKLANVRLKTLLTICECVI